MYWIEESSALTELVDLEALHMNKQIKRAQCMAWRMTFAILHNYQAQESCLFAYLQILWQQRSTTRKTVACQIDFTSRTGKDKSQTSWF